MNEYKAKAKFVRVSAQKARIPANIIRGMNATEATNVLEYMPKKAAKEIKKVLDSAIANAKYAQAKNLEELLVSKITIDKAAGYRRFKEGGRGSYKPFKRPTSHITVVVSEVEKKDEGKQVKAKSDQKEEVAPVKEAEKKSLKK